MDDGGIVTGHTGTRGPEQELTGVTFDGKQVYRTTFYLEITAPAEYRADAILLTGVETLVNCGGTWDIGFGFSYIPINASYFYIMYGDTTSSFINQNGSSILFYSFSAEDRDAAPAYIWVEYTILPIL